MSFYDEIEIEDMEYLKDLQKYRYPCPCGDWFEITISQLRDCEDVAICPSCSLVIRVIYNSEDYQLTEETSEENEFLDQIIKTNNEQKAIIINNN